MRKSEELADIYKDIEPLDEWPTASHLGLHRNKKRPQGKQLVLVVHGEQDDTVSLAAVMDWSRPQSLPVTVVPGGGHFFHGQLPLLKNLVARHLRAG